MDNNSFLRKGHPMNVLLNILFLIFMVTTTSFGQTDAKTPFIDDDPSIVKAVNCNRGGTCKLDTKFFNIKSNSTVFELDDNTLVCERKSPKHPILTKGKSWCGQCTGGGTANFFETNTGITAGSVVDVVNGKVCQIGRNEHTKNYEIRCQTSSEFFKMADPTKSHHRDIPKQNSTKRILSKGVHASLRRRNSVHQDEPRKLADDLGDTIDVMVVWSKQAECKTSGYFEGCFPSENTENNMEALVNLAVEETNTAYALSGINTELRLVHSYRDETYVEDEILDNYGKLRQLTYVNDGHLDDVHTKRSWYGADVVVLLVGDQSSCGIGWDGPQPGLMFSVVSWTCATGHYSFGHEIGHNMGCSHDRGTQDACSDTGYNFGYRDPNARFRSIMAYPCVSGQCDSHIGGNCAPVQRFSNTNFQYDGLPIGNAENDNARQINSVKAEIAFYFPAKALCLSDSDCNDGVACNGVEICNESSDRCDQGTPLVGCCGNNICEPGETKFSCAMDCIKELETALLYADHSSDGNMFKIQALSNIEVSSLDIHTFSSESMSVKVYSRKGEYTSSSSGWTLLGDFSVVGKGYYKRTPLPDFDNPVVINAGETQSFYVHSSDGTLIYSKGGMEGNLFAEKTGEIQFFEGIGMEGEYGTVLSPWIWNGVIHYSVLPNTYSSALPTTSIIPSTAPSVTSPSTAPSMSPTISCLVGQSGVEVNIITDGYPLETSWTLINVCTSEQVLTGGPYSTPQTLYTIIECVDSEQQYIFTVNDSFDDGMCCAYGPGKYDVKFAGIVVAEGGKFVSSKSTIFGNCLPATSPSFSPIRSPTFYPSTSPTPDPSTRPSSSPTIIVIPSVSPSIFRSTSASISSSVIPTIALSGRPSISPSTIPTVSPSASHSISSSLNPSTSPSINPTFGPSTTTSSPPRTYYTEQPSIQTSLYPTTDESNLDPTISPTLVPTVAPAYSTEPSGGPSSLPDDSPSVVMNTTQNPTIDAVTVPPTPNPSISLAFKPSIATRSPPSTYYSEQPSIQHSLYPTATEQSLNPTISPTLVPTVALAYSTKPSGGPGSLSTGSPSVVRHTTQNPTIDTVTVPPAPNFAPIQEPSTFFVRPGTNNVNANDNAFEASNGSNVVSSYFEADGNNGICFGNVCYGSASATVQGIGGKIDIIFSASASSIGDRYWHTWTVACPHLDEVMEITRTACSNPEQSDGCLIRVDSSALSIPKGGSATYQADHTVLIQIYAEKEEGCSNSVFVSMSFECSSSQEQT